MARYNKPVITMEDKLERLQAMLDDVDYKVEWTDDDPETLRVIERFSKINLEEKSIEELEEMLGNKQLFESPSHESTDLIIKIAKILDEKIGTSEEEVDQEEVDQEDRYDWAGLDDRYKKAEDLDYDIQFGKRYYHIPYDQTQFDEDEDEMADYY
ncbi:MAG: hypothetical protein LBT59_26535 [Clostridiales bacterium]|jgi:hypothetical protein|nr:hypothetical protein [Clostridiales bacterium]